MLCVTSCGVQVFMALGFGGGREGEARKKDKRLRSLCASHPHEVGYIGGVNQEQGGDQVAGAGHARYRSLRCGGQGYVVACGLGYRILYIARCRCAHYALWARAMQMFAVCRSVVSIRSHESTMFRGGRRPLLREGGPISYGARPSRCFQPPAWKSGALS